MLLDRLLADASEVLGELTIDQSPCAAEASGMLSDAAGCCTLSGAGCWLRKLGLPNELAPLGIPGRGGMPLNPGSPAVALLFDGSPCLLLLRVNFAPGGSGTPGGRASFGEVATAARLLVLLPNVLGKFAGAGGALVFALVVSTGGVAARLNIPRRTPAEQRANAHKMGGLKMPDFERAIFFMMFPRVPAERSTTKVRIVIGNVFGCARGVQNQGSAVPDFDLTREISALLTKPSTFTSSRKFALVTALPDCDLV